MSSPFIGEIRTFSFNFPPKGWALANGQLLAVNQNQALFSILGTNRVLILNNTNNTASGTAVFDFPLDAAVDTTGKIYYKEQHNFANGSNNNVNTLNYLTLSPLKDFVLSSVQNLSDDFDDDVLVLAPPPQPTLAVGTVTNNTTGTSVTLNGNVTADGGVTNSGIIARGFVYALTSANTTPTLTDTGTTTGTYADTATGLANGTTYYFRAYATNGVGTAYGSVLTFTTIAPPTANNQSVNVAHNTAAAVTLTGGDPNTPAQTLTYNITSQPTHGTLSGTAPNLTYTPNTGYTGGDSFTFTVSNGTNTSAAATVSLTVIGQPTITGFTPASGPVGTLVTITGINLQNAVGVNFFRNTAGTGFSVVSSTQVTVRVPTGAGTDILTVLSGSGSNNSSTKFTVTP